MPPRVPQPPVNPALRALEHHSFWPAFLVALAGLSLVVCGARHVTGVDTLEGGAAWETQLIKAFSSGGLQFADQAGAPPPPPGPDGAGAAEALDRWAKQQAKAVSPTWKLRVDLSAKTPCPT